MDAHAMPLSTSTVDADVCLLNRADVHSLHTQSTSTVHTMRKWQALQRPTAYRLSRFFSACRPNSISFRTAADWLLKRSPNR